MKNFFRKLLTGLGLVVGAPAVIAFGLVIALLPYAALIALACYIIKLFFPHLEFSFKTA